MAPPLATSHSPSERQRVDDLRFVTPAVVATALLASDQGCITGRLSNQLRNLERVEDTQQL